MNHDLVPVVAILSVFVILPGMLLHYYTKAKAIRTLSENEERLLIELNHTASRLQERMTCIETILDADHPGWKEKQL